MAPPHPPAPLRQGGHTFFEMDELNGQTRIHSNVKAKRPGLTIIENVVYLISMYCVLSTFHAFLSLTVINKISSC